MIFSDMTTEETTLGTANDPVTKTNSVPTSAEGFRKLDGLGAHVGASKGFASISYFVNSILIILLLYACTVQIKSKALFIFFSSVL
jgi:hypothetical protein